MSNTFEMHIAKTKDSQEDDVFGVRLRACLKKNAISGTALAQTLNLRPSTISAWLTGANYPPLLVFRALCHMLKADPAWLLGITNTDSGAIESGPKLLTRDALIGSAMEKLASFSFILEQEQVPFPIPSAMEFVFNYKGEFTPGHYCLVFWKKTSTFSLHRIVAEANKIFLKTLAGPVLLLVNELQNDDYQIFGVAYSANLTL